MPINQQHQLEVLKDILVNHQSDCCGTVSECEQRASHSIVTRKR